MVSINAIADAIVLYAREWKQIIVPFGVIFLISLLFGILNLGLSFIFNIVWMGYAISFIERLIDLIIIMAALNPLMELVEKNRITSDWICYLGSKLVDIIKVMLFRFVITILIVLPVIIIVLLNAAAVLAAVQSIKTIGISGLFVTLETVFGIIGIAVLIMIVIAVVVNVLLIFLEMEVIVAGKGLISAAKSSFALVKSNPLGVLLFILLWGIIEILVVLPIHILFICTVCLIPVAFAITPLVITPIMWISKLILWKELCKNLR